MSTLLYNGRFLLLLGITFVVIFSATATYFCLPILISHLITQQILISPSSGSYNEWRLNTIPVFDQFYLYNITNIEEVIWATKTSAVNSGIKHTTIKLSQVGPITFVQTRYKQNIDWSGENETVRYNQHHRWNFRPDLSVDKSQTLNQTIYHMNLPLSGTTLSSEYADAINPLVEEHNLKLFVNHSINELMFGGYHDTLMEVAKESGQIDIDKFGWLYNQNDSLVGTFRIFTGAGSNENIRHLGLVDQYNFANELNVWRKGSTCNQFKLSSAGDLYPPPVSSPILSASYMRSATRQKEHQNKRIDGNERVENEKLDEAKFISLFLPEICRTLKLVHNGTRDFDGLTVDRYIANEFTFRYDRDESNDFSAIPKQIQIRENQCYCTFNDNGKMIDCPPDGMMDLFSCRKGSPLTISFPHLLYSDSNDPYKTVFEDDVIANENDHQFYIDLEKTLNIPVRVQASLQFNVHLKMDPKLEFVNDYKFMSPKTHTNSSLNDIYIPQMWFKSVVKLDSLTLDKLKFLQTKLSFVTPIVTIIFFSVAFVLLLSTAMAAYRISYEARSKEGQKFMMKSSSTASIEQPTNKSEIHSLQRLRLAQSSVYGESSSAAANEIEPLNTDSRT